MRSLTVQTVLKMLFELFKERMRKRERGEINFNPYISKLAPICTSYLSSQTNLFQSVHLKQSLGIYFTIITTKQKKKNKKNKH